MDKRISVELAEQGVEQDLLPNGTWGVVAVHVNPGIVHDGLYEVIGSTQLPVLGGREEHAEVAHSIDVYRVLWSLPEDKARQDVLRSAEIELEGGGGGGGGAVVMVMLSWRYLD